MDWDLAVSIAVFAVTICNMVIALRINLAASRLETTLKEWAREHFLAAGEADRRFQQIEEGMRGLEHSMTTLWNGRS